MEQTTLINACNQPTPLDILFRKQPVWSTQENTYFIPKSLTIIYLMINKKLMSKIGFHKHCFLKSQIQQGLQKMPSLKGLLPRTCTSFFLCFFVHKNINDNKGSREYWLTLTFFSIIVIFGLWTTIEMRCLSVCTATSFKHLDIHSSFKQIDKDKKATYNESWFTAFYQLHQTPCSKRRS